MQGLNTIQAAWEVSGQPLLGTTVDQPIKAAFFAGASAALALTKSAAALSDDAFHGIMAGLEDEIRAFATGYAERPRRDLAAHPTPAQAAPVIRGFHTFAIPLAREAAIKAGCERLVAWLLEAIQHALLAGFTETEIRDDIAEHLEWWHARFHDGWDPGHAASRAASQLAEQA
jgi:hypothetical protein